ncbi:hypothetical protein HMPREF0201_00652 [Cedecea davisae DSM 4568]|uniref:Uncharacterized protein n=1 Tax=Cedecea davisae DSM 4568 TaxID=566551 RepID=S3J8C1_9ENTR|nr:hypothetical protein HMPREF0201_00652 [Cedecea davisae DSM 4568]
MSYLLSFMYEPWNYLLPVTEVTVINLDVKASRRLNQSAREGLFSPYY